MEEFVHPISLENGLRLNVVSAQPYTQRWMRLKVSNSKLSTLLDLTTFLS